MSFHLLLAFGLAALLPIALVITGVELRRVRLRIVEDLRGTVFVNDKDLPQLMLARARYDRALVPRRRKSALPREEDIGPQLGRQDEVKQYFGALIYTLVCLAGFILLFVPVDALIDAGGRSIRIPDALFWLTERPLKGSVDPLLRRTAAIAGSAFLGGYIFNMRYLIRQTLNQELSALAFVRAALRLLQGIILAVVVYQVGATILPDPDVVEHTTAGVSIGLGSALAVAFILGYFPDLGIGRVAQVARIRIKEVDRNALGKARIIPLEIIDGIDHEVSFRLQESNLYDVQNLAVANPIELYAETPYTLLQVFDWVLQAQLCLVAGVEAFNELKRHKIRTIFDLERATLSTGVPEPYLFALADILLSDSSGPFRAAIGIPAKFGDAPIAAAATTPLIVRHIVAIVSDDLHVHRLRALWRAIMETTAGGADGKPLWLFETPWLPGDPAPLSAR